MSFVHRRDLLTAAATVLGVALLPNGTTAKTPGPQQKEKSKIMSTPVRILIVLTSTGTMGSHARQTGVWFEEMSTPFLAFRDAGAAVTLASIRGGRPPIDPNSIKPKGENDAEIERFLASAEAVHAFDNTLSIAAVNAADYDAVFLAGGHGAMWDFPDSALLKDLLEQAWADGKVVAAVCHGPAGLLNVTDQNGQPIVKGRRVAGFSDSEEHAMDLEKTVPFLLENRLRALGGLYESGPNFQSFALADGRLVTGQNPPSSAQTAYLVLQAIANREQAVTESH